LVGGYIFWDKKETMPTYSKGELAWVSNMNRVDKYEFLWSGYKKQVNEKRIHPTQKPVSLYKWLLENYTSEGDLILDTHLGSGSIAIACHYMKRRLVGYEIDAEYYEKACKRFKEQTAQQALW
jgi:site-specific DNA-methyltransferase (adenine-specific)